MTNTTDKLTTLPALLDEYLQVDARRSILADILKSDEMRDQYEPPTNRRKSFVADGDKAHAVLSVVPDGETFDKDAYITLLESELGWDANRIKRAKARKSLQKERAGYIRLKVSLRKDIVAVTAAA